ncbi:MAG: hypothetical protein IKH30_15640 [Clostridia bacterium]|nr:hypothetical protein [Clostridia bacterium]
MIQRAGYPKHASNVLNEIQFPSTIHARLFDMIAKACGNGDDSFPIFLGMNDEGVIKAPDGVYSVTGIDNDCGREIQIREKSFHFFHGGGQLHFFVGVSLDINICEETNNGMNEAIEVFERKRYSRSGDHVLEMLFELNSGRTMEYLFLPKLKIMFQAINEKYLQVKHYQQDFELLWRIYHMNKYTACYQVELAAASFSSAQTIPARMKYAILVTTQLYSALSRFMEQQRRWLPWKRNLV